MLQKVLFRLLIIAVAMLVLASFSTQGGTSHDIEVNKPAPPRTDLFRQAYADAIGLSAQQETDRQVAAYLEALEIERQQVAAYLETIKPKPPTSGGGGGGGDPAACVRAHESDTSGGYSAVNPNGHYGAYQFSQSTWDNTMRAMGLYQYVGVRPDQAPPDIQDAAFTYLYGGGSGASHWAGSGC